MSLRACEQVFHRGHIVPAGLAGLQLDDHAVHFGTAAFESLRILPTSSGPRLLAWSLHRQRLEHSLRTLGLDPIAPEQLTASVAEFADRNRMSDGYLRILAYPDGDATRFDPSDYPTTFSILGWHSDHRAALPPLHLDVAALRQPNLDGDTALAKLTGSYALATISHMRARRGGFEDAVKLHTDGTVCEGTGANLFIVRGGELLTPELPHSIDGTTRRLVMAMAAHVELPVTVAPMTLDELQTADEAFLTGTYFGISPVRAVAHREMRTAAPGPITQRLRDTFFEWIGNPDHVAARDWFEPLPPRSARPAPSPRCTVRLAKPADVDAVLAGVRALLAELRGVDEVPLPDAARATCARWIESADAGLVLVAERHGVVGVLTLGLAEAIHAGGRVAVIQELWVHPDLRSAGVGEALVEAAVSAARERGVEQVEVGLPRHRFANLARTQKFYDRCGFELIGPRMRMEIKNER